MYACYSGIFFEKKGKEKQNKVNPNFWKTIDYRANVKHFIIIIELFIGFISEQKK